MNFFRKRKKREERDPLERITLQYTGFVTIPELAFILRVSVQTVHNWARRGEREFKLDGFPQMQIRRKKWGFLLPDIEQFFDVELSDSGRQFAYPLLSHKDILSVVPHGDTTVRGWMREEGKRIGRVLLRIERKRLEEFLKDKYQRNLLEQYPKIPVITV
jgi:hypothetical protein